MHQGPRRHRRLIAASLLLTLGLAACGGKEGPHRASPAAWATEMCGHARTYVDAITTNAKIADDAIIDLAEPTSAIAALSQAATAASSATTELVDHLRQMDAPDVPGGDALQVDLVSAVRPLEAPAADLARRAAVLPADDPIALSEQAPPMTVTMRDGLTAFRDGVRRARAAHPSTSLDAAIKAVSDCDALDG